MNVMKQNNGFTPICSKLGGTQLIVTYLIYLLTMVITCEIFILLHLREPKVTWK